MGTVMSSAAFVLRKEAVQTEKKREPWDLFCCVVSILFPCRWKLPLHQEKEDIRHLAGDPVKEELPVEEWAALVAPAQDYRTLVWELELQCLDQWRQEEGVMGHPLV